MNQHPNYRYTFVLLAFLFFQGAVAARPVTPEDAALVGKHFFESTNKGRALANQLNLTLVYGGNLDAMLEATPKFYIFNINTADGFVIVSADDMVRPVLGYAEQGVFHTENMPVNLSKTLDQYKQEIFYTIENDIKPTQEVAQQWVDLRIAAPDAPESLFAPPLIQTTWNQAPFYNDLCPGGSVTGCVATAMAQIMKYWNHPFQGAGGLTYIELDYGAVYANFGGTFYDWFNMPNNVVQPTSTVATVMYHCGVAVQMNYSPQGSGAYPGLVGPALANYFRYDPTYQYIYKNDYSESGWINAIKAEIDAQRPIFYAGFGSGGGHAFICDGYDNNNFLHFNWGWGGVSDGYFASTALNPGSLGTGGGDGGFNSDQMAIIQIKPRTSPDLTLMEPFVLSSSFVTIGGNIHINTRVLNQGGSASTNDFCIGIYNESDGKLVKTIGQVTQALPQFGNYIFDLDLNTGELLPGKYHLSVLEGPVNATFTQWTKIPSSTNLNIKGFEIESASSMQIINAPSISVNPVVSNSPFSVSASVVYLSANPELFTGDVSIDLHQMDGTYITEIARRENLSLGWSTPSSLTFQSEGLNVAPGNYKIVVWARKAGETWNIIQPAAFSSEPFFIMNWAEISVVPAPLLPDPYDPNENDYEGYQFGLTFVDNVATFSTDGSNFHQANDKDFYYFQPESGYNYTISARVHDAGNSGNGQSYTADARWSYRAGTGSVFSASFDDVLLTPVMSFTTPFVDYIDFLVTPYLAGTLGTYLFEGTVTRTPTSGTEEELPEQSVGIYPNPANSWAAITVSDGSQMMESVQVFNMNGGLVMAQNRLKVQQYLLTTSGFTEGVYSVVVRTDKGVWRSKLVVGR